MTTKRNGTFEPKIVRPSFLQLWKHKCQKLWRRLKVSQSSLLGNSAQTGNETLGIQKKSQAAHQCSESKLTIMRGGKVELKSFESKAHTYNPREFRTDKGPRK